MAGFFLDWGQARSIIFDKLLQSFTDSNGQAMGFFLRIQFIVHHYNIVRVSPFISQYLLRSLRLLLLAVVIFLHCSKAFAFTSGDRVQVNSSIGVNVRNSAGGSKYDSGQPLGAKGVIIGNSTDAVLGGVNYTWWYVDFDSGQDGWVATVGMTTIVPDPPTLIAPGNGSNVPIVSTLTPTFQWNPVLGATSYGLYVQQGDSFPIDIENIGNVTSYTVPAGVLQSGGFYVWNMRAKNSAGPSGFSSGPFGRFYFQIQLGPKVTTVFPPDVKATSATLVGDFDANGTATTYYFQYGLDSSYGETTPGYNIGTASGRFETQVTGLKPSSTYHFRAVASNAVGTSFGDDLFFTTSSSRPSNDNFADRISITAPTLSVTGNNAEATKEAGEPNHVGATTGRKSVWWTWTPIESGIFTISTSGSSFDTLLAVYTGSSVSALSLVASNDDYEIHSTSLLTFNAYAGTAYQIAVDGNGGLSGNIQLTISPSNVPPPTARIVVSDQHPVTGKVIRFDASSSTGSRPLKYTWTLDGALLPFSEAAFEYQFNSPRTYVMGVTVLDPFAHSSSKSIPINVQAGNIGITPGRTTGADPVVLSTGNYIQSHVDLSMPGTGFGFEFRRFYNSKFSDQSGLPLGFGWTFNYNERIHPSGTNILAVRGDGSTVTFSPTPNSGYVAEPGVYDSLARDSSTEGWSLTDKVQTVKIFDKSGSLLSITDKNQNRLQLVYDESRFLKEVHDTSGRIVRFSRGASGCISSIIDPIGRTIDFEYDERTNLVAVVDANRNKVRYSYDANHHMTDAFDAKGVRYIHNEFDPSTFTVAKQCDALTNWTFFAYDFDQRITVQTNSLGGVSSHYFDENLLTTKIVDEEGHEETFAYDNNHNQTLTRDKNSRETLYEYDGHGNLTKQIDAKNGITTIGYDERNNPTLRTDALGNSIYFTYSGIGNLIATTNALGLTSGFHYDRRGLPIVARNLRGFSTTNEYDVEGNLLAIIDAKGIATHFEYDPIGRKVREIDQLNRTNSFAYDANNNLLLTVNALGFTNVYYFDENNNRTSFLDSRSALTTWHFDLKGRNDGVVGPENNVVSNIYDALDRRIATVDAMGSQTAFGYDKVGNLTNVTNALARVTAFFFDPQGNQTASIDPSLHSLEISFDELNREVGSINTWISTNLTLYDAFGNITATTNANGRMTRYFYDAVGRLTNLTDAASQSTFFQYDENGNRTNMTDPNGHAWTRAFDELSRLTEELDPLGHKLRLEYDAAGNLTNKLTPNGDNIRFLYDALNRLTNIVYPSGTPVHFEYDSVGNRKSMTDGMGTTDWKYDLRDQLRSVTDPFGQTVSYGYDSNGNRTSITYPGEKTVTYGFDSLNRLAAVTNWLGGVTTYSYDARGNLQGSIASNGSSVHYGYDVGGRLIGLTNLASDKTVISKYSVALDGVGNRIASDHMEPLIPLLFNKTNFYTYDADNRLTAINNEVVSHNPNGNITGIGGSIYKYDFDDRLVQISSTDTVDSFSYDGLGNRLVRSTQGEDSKYVLDRSGGLSQILVETDASGSPLVYYIYGIGLAERITPDGTVSTYHFNPQGSTIALTDTNNLITDSYAYDSFGALANSDTESSQPFRYLGQYGILDDGTGLYYARARYFNPHLGRFITKDPIGGQDIDPQSLNRYVYALNNPLRFADPSGLCAAGDNSLSDRTFWPSFGQFDNAELILLRYWIEGHGGELTLEGPEWENYMRQNSFLTSQVSAKLIEDAKTRKSSGSLQRAFHADLDTGGRGKDSGYRSGYGLLGGSNSDVGDFVISGFAKVMFDSNGDRTISYSLNNQWNDKLDPNSNYWRDNAFAFLLRHTPGISPANYVVHLNWKSTASVTLDSRNLIKAVN